MPERKLQAILEYRYGKRGVLRPGDRFYIAGGPVWVTKDGREIDIADRGLCTFVRLLQARGERWLEVILDDVLIRLWVGKSHRSKVDPQLRRRPYRIGRKLRPTTRR